MDMFKATASFAAICSFIFSLCCGVSTAMASSSSFADDFVDPQMVSPYGHLYWQNKYLDMREKKGDISCRQLAELAFGLGLYNRSSEYLAKIENPTADDYALHILSLSRMASPDKDAVSGCMEKLKEVDKDGHLYHYVRGYLSERTFLKGHDKKDLLSAIHDYAISDSGAEDLSFGDTRLIKLFTRYPELKKNLPKESKEIQVFDKFQAKANDKAYAGLFPDLVMRIQADAFNQFFPWKLYYSDMVMH